MLIGIDVGENFLDLATLRAGALERSRIGLAGIEGDPIAVLGRRLAAACGGIGAGWLAAIDSPRWPIDLDAAIDYPRPRRNPPRSREIDRVLRELARRSQPPLRLSMFPTPRLSNFAAQAAASNQPHLKAVFAQLFPGAGGGEMAPPRAGLRFTRFMLAGFAVFRALEALGVRAVESYPDLQFRLWARMPLAHKRSRHAALDSRRTILAHIWKLLELSTPGFAPTLDQADAEVLATTALLAARQGSLALLENDEEGAFLVAGPPGRLPPYIS